MKAFDLVGPFGGSFVVSLRKHRQLSDVPKICALTPFHWFYLTLQLLCLLRPHSRPQNPTFLMLGAKQSFYTKSRHNFLCLQNPRNMYFLETKFFGEHSFLLRRTHSRLGKPCFKPNKLGQLWDPSPLCI